MVVCDGSVPRIVSREAETNPPEERDGPMPFIQEIIVEVSDDGRSWRQVDAGRSLSDLHFLQPPGPDRLTRYAVEHGARFARSRVRDEEGWREPLAVQVEPSHTG